MAGVRILCDTGPLVAFFNRHDQYHSWAAEQFNRIFQPLLTCEPVLSEVVFLLQDDGLSSDPLFESIDRALRGQIVANGSDVAGFVPQKSHFFKGQKWSELDPAGRCDGNSPPHFGGGIAEDFRHMPWHHQECSPRIERQPHDAALCAL